MPQYATKSSPVFFSTTDELRLDHALKEAFPSLAYVDGSLWDSETPPAKEHLSDCLRSVVFLWDRESCPKLPNKQLETGQFRGPTSGVVIQYGRSELKDKYLLSGDFGIGYDKSNEAMAHLVKGVWKILKQMNATKLCVVEKETGKAIVNGIRDYIVGADAARLSMEGTLLKHVCTEAYYRSE
jgi:hypothetical protein